MHMGIDKNVVKSNNSISVLQDLSFDPRLYDNQASMRRQSSAKGSGISKFDVSNLHDGVYYLHFYNGITATPEVHKVIVKH